MTACQLDWYPDLDVTGVHFNVCIFSLIGSSGVSSSRASVRRPLSRQACVTPDLTDVSRQAWRIEMRLMFYLNSRFAFCKYSSIETTCCNLNLQVCLFIVLLFFVLYIFTRFCWWKDVGWSILLIIHNVMPASSYHVVLLIIVRLSCDFLVSVIIR